MKHTMKKTLLLIMAFTVLLSFSFVTDSDARRGGYKAPKRSYTETPSKPADNTSKVQPGNKASTGTGTGAGAATTANRGFFSGGSLAKGLMIGGLAGLLFGGMFANMGAFGDFLGLLVNVLAIYILFVAIRGIFRYLKQQKRPGPNDPYNNQRRY